jgi:GWxTD domain-containing protein
MPGQASLASFSLAAWLLAAGAVSGFAEGPPVDTKRFPRLARILLLPEEASLLKELKDDKDRVEFQKIFWARRDPTPGTPANEFEDHVRAVWSRADELFSYPNQKGSETGCGQVLALLGRPEEVLGLDVQAHFDSLRDSREGSRRPETWVYRDRPGLPYTFTRAELRIAFDPECRFAEGGIVAQDLNRAAATFVTRPDLAHARGSDGHLVPLTAAAAASSGTSAGARALLAAPRNDFPLAAEWKVLMRGPKGEAYAAGLVRASTVAGLPARLSLAAQATDAAGQAIASAAREMTARPEADGSLVASWGLSLKPGRYRVAVAALLPEPNTGSVSAIDVDVPDFGGATLVASPLVLYPDEPSAPGPAAATDPYAALQLGPMRLHPRFGNVFTTKDALMVVATLYGAKVDPATGQAALRSHFTILKDGRPVARGAEDAFTTADAVASVGPIPLAPYTPGAYVVRLDVTDAVAKQTLRQEAAFEIRNP